MVSEQGDEGNLYHFVVLFDLGAYRGLFQPGAEPEGVVCAAREGALGAPGPAAKACVEGARVATSAALVEQAQREMKTARDTYSKAQDAVATWN